MAQKFGLKAKAIPKDEWEWSDWRSYEIDMAYAVWKHAYRGKEIIKIHYGD
jgi:hypothetical protein